MRKWCLLLCLSIVGISTFSQQVQNLIERGIDSYEDTQFEEAWAHFNEALIYEPLNVDALLGRGKSLYQLGVYPESRTDLKKAMKLGASVSAPLNLIGKMYINEGNCDSAMVYLGQLVKADSTRYDAVVEIASCLRELGRAPEALNWISRKGVPAGSRVSYEKGRIYIELKEYKQALDEFGRVGKGEYAADARFWTGRCYLFMEEFSTAAATFNSIFIKDKRDSEVLFYRGQSYLLARNLVMAHKDFVELSQRYPSDLEILDRKAHCEFLLEYYPRAKSTYSRIVDLNPENPEAWFKRGLCKYQLGEYQTAIDDFGVVADRYPEDADVQFYLGMCYMGLKDWIPAKSMLENVLDLAPEYHRATYSLGTVELKLGQKALACAKWTKLLGTPLEPQAKESLAAHCN